MKQLAQIDLYVGDGYKGLGDSPLANPAGDGISTFSAFISSAIGLITIIGIIWFIFIFITGAIGIISSGGDKGSLESSKKKISTGLIGLVILIVSVFAIDLVGYLLGFSNIGGILNIGELFGLIQFQ